MAARQNLSVLFGNTVNRRGTVDSHDSSSLRKHVDKNRDQRHFKLFFSENSPFVFFIKLMHRIKQAYTISATALPK